MPATRYKIWAVGPPVGKGATQSINVGVSGIAKSASTTLPYVVANELICGRLAQALLLPTPPGYLIEKAGTPYYVSMNFNLAGEDLPPADCGLIVQKHLDISWGIILFDAWVLNHDRHSQNLAYDSVTDKVQIFDHSHAFVANANDIEAHLNSNVDKLAIGNHCLAQEVNALQGINKWALRIAAVPEYYIREVVKAAESVGLPPLHTDVCTDFLLHRRNMIRDLIKKNPSTFPKVAPMICNISTELG